MKQKEREIEEILLSSSRNLLDQELHAMNDQVIARLRASRQRALNVEKKTFSSPWMIPATGIALACTSILLFFFLTQGPVKNNMETVVFIPDIVDLELLASTESYEFYDDLEFYEWLAENKHAG
ncbi:MAG: hypothetical protein ACE5FY_01005 [Nitrospiria bacterium]